MQLIDYHYEEQIIKNTEKHYKKQKNTLLRKRLPEAFEKKVEFLSLDMDSMSTRTETDQECNGQADLESESEEEQV
jgi:hypothetical protein